MRKSEQKISKDMKDLIKTINQLDLNNIFRTLQPITAENTFFPNVHEAFVKIDHILGHKTRFNKFKRIKTNEICSLTTM